MLQSLSVYRIRVIKPPLLIKPPLIQNSNKPPLFCPKSPFFGAFLVKFWKNFNKPPAQNLNFLIDCRRFIGADTVVENNTLMCTLKTQKRRS